MIVYLARHGETTGNRRGLILGRRDYPLIPSGMQVSRRLALRIPAEGEGIILSSPLGRAAATAGIFSEATGWPIEMQGGMTEITCGEWEGRPRVKVAPGREFLRLDWNDSPPQGESYSDTESRVSSVISTITALPGFDAVVVIGHGSVNRVFLKLWLDMKPDEAMKIRHPHDLVYILDDGRGVRWINADGQEGHGFR